MTIWVGTAGAIQDMLYLTVLPDMAIRNLQPGSRREAVSFYSAQLRYEPYSARCDIANYPGPAVQLGMGVGQRGPPRD
jgi:hypothetical protein